VCEREWEVFLRLGMEFESCSCGGEVGVSIYRCGSKTSRFYFSAQNPVEPIFKPIEPVSSRLNSSSMAS
jgi:hypothetical protein